MNATNQVSIKFSNRNMPSKANQSGFTIVEIMIAGTLGIILMAGVIQLFVGSNRNYTLQDELAGIQEDGRFAMIFLENEIQRGGWIDDFNERVPPAVDLALSLDGVSDSVAVSYKVPIDGISNVDCNGANVADGYITNTFSVGGNSGEELMCLGNGTGAVAQPLINGVKNFQVLYGVESNATCPDGAVNQYMTRDQVLAGGSNLVVVSVRVAVLIASGDNVLDESESVTHDLLDTQFTSNDQLAYRTFQQTIYMPNSIFSTAGNPDMAVTCLANNIGT
jgi:type IV pilus assembly protein PilW